MPAVSTPDIRRPDRPVELAPEDIQLVVDEPLSLEARDDAPEIVQALPVQSFVTVARKLRTEQRLDLLLPYATPEQITGIFDLDAWEKDRLAVYRAREWLDRIAEAYRESHDERGRLVQLMYDTDPELWVLATAAATAVAELEPDDDEQRQQVLDDLGALQTWETPDGFYIVGVPDNELGTMTLRVLEAIYEDNMVEGRKLVSSIKWALYAEVEEDLLRWRRGRLADLGFPVWDEAMKLFSPLGRDAAMGRDRPEPEPRAADGSRPAQPEVPRIPTKIVALTPSLRGEGKDLLRRVMQRLGDEEYDLRLREFALLANELMAAQRFEPGDEALQERAIEQAQATLNLSFELLVASEQPIDPEGFLAERIADVGLRKLFRHGYGPLAKLRKAALALHKAGQVSLREVGSLLDRPWGPALATFVRWYPELPLEEKQGHRPLRSLADLARATSLIGEAEALARLTFAAEGYGVDPVWLTRVDEPTRVLLGDLVRTAIICAHMPGGPATGLRPLTGDDLLWARDALLIGGHLDPRVRDDLLARARDLGVEDRADTLADVLLPRLAMELANLELHERGPDLTRVGGLLTIQQVGMWLTTTAGDTSDGA